MTDSEVGELWHDLHVKKPADIRGEIYQETMVDLIRKLVEERCHRSKLGDALCDFGIELKIWEKK